MSTMLVVYTSTIDTNVMDTFLIYLHEFETYIYIYASHLQKDSIILLLIQSFYYIIVV